MSHPILVEVLRGAHVESAHSGSLAIVDADGRLLRALGDIERPIFPRSAVKALQALPLVESGAADRFALTDAELAIACASHSGEPAHVATSLGMLNKLGLDERALECGSHWPSREPVLRGMLARGETASALHNNCSGKHAGFVCVACQMALAQGHEPAEFVRGYIAPEHALMREVSAALAAATDCDLSQAPRGTDGCSIPTYGIPLRNLALGFARLGTGQGLSAGRAAAAKRLRQAVAAAPFYVAGSERFDTVLMQALGERLFCKVGAEGVYCASFPELGLGLALKIDDGQVRAAECAMAAIAQALLPTPGEEAAALLARYADMALHNWQGVHVGAVRASEALTAGLR
nr:asparaginase [uncultured Roseateles sp.]